MVFGSQLSLVASNRTIEIIGEKKEAALVDGQHCLDGTFDFGALPARFILNGNLTLGLDVVVVMLEDGPEVCFLNGVCEKAGSASTDVILTCAGHQFKVHRFILASRSPFFKDILTNNEETEAEVRWQWKKCFL